MNATVGDSGVWELVWTGVALAVRFDIADHSRFGSGSYLPSPDVRALIRDALRVGGNIPPDLGELLEVVNHCADVVR